MRHSSSEKFFKNDDFEFMTELALGATYHRGADIGECLATIARIEDGDAESWFVEWRATAERIATIAADCEAAGHRVSARQAWLRAASYYDAATFFLDLTKDPDRLVPTWGSIAAPGRDSPATAIRRSSGWRSPTRGPSSRAGCSGSTAAASAGRC
jgi:hypothetical protein